MKKACIGLGVVVSMIFFCLPSFAQEKFPSKPIYIIVGQAAGGSTDIIARSLEPFLNKELKVPIVVQNQTGAGGDIANNFVWKAKPDGYTLIMTVIPSYAIRELIKKQNFEVLKMTFVYGIAGGDFNAIAVASNSPIKNFDDLKKAASEKMLSVGGTTPGSNSWYAYIMMREKTGIKFKYVPYNSGTQAALAAVGGHVDLAITSIISLVRPAKNKQVRIIAGFGDKRDEMFPDVPMMVEFGYKDMHFSTRQGLAGPPGMPKEIVDVIGNGTAKAVRDPKFEEIAKRQGFTLDPMPGPEFYKWTDEIHEQAKNILGHAGELAK
jgi:tripartite-type tricarboxylate transporter receptor subunit TctC